MDPSHIFGRNTIDYEENYNNFVNRLLEETDARDAPIELVLSPLFNGKETIYRIVDTELLFWLISMHMISVLIIIIV